MPSTRKSTGGRQATGPGKQSTLSFSHRVTKTVPKSAKDSVVSPSIAKPAQPEEAKPAELEDEADDVQVEPTPEPELEPELDEDQESEIVPEKSEAELAAEKVSNAAIERYWRKLESQRMAKQVHQEGLSTGERVLRYFDVSSQYGVRTKSFLLSLVPSPSRTSQANLDYSPAWESAALGDGSERRSWASARRSRFLLCC